MRNRSFIPLVAAFIAGACGDRTPKTSDANAAEVSTVSTDTAGAPTPPPVPAGPVSFEEAHTAFKEKRYDEAVRMFTSYTAGKPDNVWGYYMLGLSAWKGGDPDGAVGAFTLALEKDSTHAKSRLNLSRVLIEQGKAQEALPHVEAVLQIDSTSSEAYRLLGRVEFAQGDVDGAITAYIRSVQLNDGDVWAMNNLGHLYIEEQRFDEAIGPLARAVEIEAGVASFWNNLGIALERTGRVTQAADAYQAGLAIDSTNEKVSANLDRVEGLTQDSSVVPVDLSSLARAFVERVKTSQ
jgi:tetratricopeptide (TPR) repeat protein